MTPNVIAVAARVTNPSDIATAAPAPTHSRPT
jgi:hypothetical protein